jgi:hypothetical protein
MTMVLILNLYNLSEIYNTKGYTVTYNEVISTLSKSGYPDYTQEDMENIKKLINKFNCVGKKQLDHLEKAIDGKNNCSTMLKIMESQIPNSPIVAKAVKRYFDVVREKCVVTNSDSNLLEKANQHARELIKVILSI